ncbi:hypothetical protein A9Z63_04150 [Moraxella lacunata]|uniref:Uncharacterized protein n=1 Tax=Moraxella lacunata TaxID=477 RepID=A0A1B8Q2P6_MORLA|nr:hypothetical protein A9309_06460 [Moraxella lacunata]OBX64215.1 hypothetical protein A9Z63_04150 [Moraxella lacunata]
MTYYTLVFVFMIKTSVMANKNNLGTKPQSIKILGHYRSLSIINNEVKTFKYTVIYCSETFVLQNR